MIDTDTKIPTYQIAISRYQLEKKIQPGDPIWPRFNACFNNQSLTTERLLEKIYAGHAITTWHKDHWRTSANYLAGQHIGLDFDSGDKSSSLDALCQDKFISRYAAFLYTTMSHTPEAPRSRVIFLLDAPIMQAKNYTLAVQSVLWLFGTADRQCKDAVRFFYGSPRCDFEIFSNVLPLETVKKLIGQYLETGAKEKHHAARKDYAAPTSQQEVADALKLIPPWGIDYDEWLAVLMGIHAAFGEAGFALAESWANGKPGEVEQKWRSFHASDGITVASVFGIAKKFGWRKQDAAISEATH